MSSSIQKSKSFQVAPSLIQQYMPYALRPVVFTQRPRGPRDDWVVLSDARSGPSPKKMRDVLVEV
eukprot:5719638-Amphidinium_carterae.1